MTVTAREIMTSPVITVNRNATIKKAIELIAAHTFSGLPVVDDENKLVGILSEADILNFSHRENVVPLICLSGWISPYTEISDIAVIKKGSEMLSYTKTEKAMSRKIITAGPETPVSDLVKTMSKKNINRIPVVDKEGKIIGIVTRADIIRSFSQS